MPLINLSWYHFYNLLLEKKLCSAWTWLKFVRYNIHYEKRVIYLINFPTHNKKKPVFGGIWGDFNTVFSQSNMSSHIHPPHLSIYLSVYPTCFNAIFHMSNFYQFSSKPVDKNNNSHPRYLIVNLGFKSCAIVLETTNL